MKSLIPYAAALFLAATAFAGQHEGTAAGDNQAAEQKTGDEDEASGPRETLDDAQKVVEQMKKDPQLVQLLEKTHGVFIIPNYGKAAAVVGGQGGEGVVLLRADGGDSGDWTAPVFYDFGGASVGAEIGIKAGSMVMLLMSQEAADRFRNEESEWSLTAGSGLTVVDYSAVAQAAAPEQDVIVWSDTEGAFVGADIGIRNINRDQEENASFHGENVNVQELLAGGASGERARELRAALPD